MVLESKSVTPTLGKHLKISNLSGIAVQWNGGLMKRYWKSQAFNRVGVYASAAIWNNFRETP